MKHKPAHAVPVASARPDQNPKEMASQSGPGGPWPTGARWRVRKGTPTHNNTPGRGLVFFGITFFTETSCGGNCGIRLSPAWASPARLGLVVRSRVPTQPHFPGVCHWASEPTGRQAAESPSRRATERASARNSSSPCPHRPQGPFKTCPANAKAEQRRVPAFASSHRPLTHTHTLGHLQWPEPPRFL